MSASTLSNGTYGTISTEYFLFLPEEYLFYYYFFNFRKSAEHLIPMITIIIIGVLYSAKYFHFYVLYINDILIINIQLKCHIINSKPLIDILKTK